MPLSRFAFGFLAILLASGLGLVRPARAQSDPTGPAALVVTTSDNTVANDGDISLREAIQTANTDGVDSVITFDKSKFRSSDGAINLLGTRLPNLANNGTLSISASPTGLVISGNNATTVFLVDPGAQVSMKGLTIRAGRSTDD